MNNIDVVLVTYNRLLLLKECIGALEKQISNIANIFVINNHSNDGTEEYLNSLKSSERFQIENLNKNMGGAAGFEYGVKKAMDKGNGKYVWIMDDDTIPTENASDQLISAARKLDNKFGFLCSNVRWINGDPTNIPEPSKKWSTYIEDGLVEVESATFVSIFVKKIGIKTVGLPLGQLQIWGDDTEYTTRLSHYEPSYLVSQSIVVHKTAKNLSDDTLKNISKNRIWRYKCMYRNLVFIDRKYHSKTRVVKRILKNGLDALSALSAKSQKFERSWAAISGTVKGLWFNPKIDFVHQGIESEEKK